MLLGRLVHLKRPAEETSNRGICTVRDAAGAGAFRLDSMWIVYPTEIGFIKKIGSEVFTKASLMCIAQQEFGDFRCSAITPRSELYFSQELGCHVYRSGDHRVE